MRSRLTALFLVSCLCCAGRLAAADPPKLVAETPPLSPDEQLQKFRLPPGFRIELIAAEPEVPKPINLNFDAAGRLYATCSLEYPYPAEGDATPRDAIKLILDSDGNGVPDRLLKRPPLAVGFGNLAFRVRGIGRGRCGAASGIPNRPAVDPTPDRLDLILGQRCAKRHRGLLFACQPQE